MCDKCEEWKSHAETLQRQVNVLSEGYLRQREELEACGEKIFTLNSQLQAAWERIETLNKA